MDAGLYDGLPDDPLVPCRRCGAPGVGGSGVSLTKTPGGLARELIAYCPACRDAQVGPAWESILRRLFGENP